MTSAQIEALQRIATRRWRVAVVLTSLMLISYFGFILLVAFDRPLMGMLLSGGQISFGIVLGALVILCAPVLTGIYVYWANRRYDGAIAALREAGEKKP
jgi:uncharacterized membrane protein (DUF485 family)